MTTSFLVFALTMSLARTAAAQSPAPGGTPPAQVPAGGQALTEAARLALDRALTSVLEGQIAQIGGPAVDENGAEFGSTIKMGLVLIKGATIQQFREAQAQLQALKTMPQAQREAELARIQALAPEARDAYNEMTNLDANVLKGDLKGEARGRWENAMSEAGDLDKAGQRERAEGRRREAGELAWGRYLAARQRFYRAIGRHPLLGVRLPGTWRQLWLMDSPYFFFRVLQPGVSTTEQLTQFDAHIDKLIAQLREQELRVSNMKTWKELYELGSPAFAQTQNAAAAVTGDLGKGLVDAVTATNAGTRAVAAYQNAFSDTALSIIQVGSLIIPVAGPLVSAGITGIQVYKSGDEYVIALTEEKNATAGATVTGYQAVIDASDKAGAAGGRLLVNVAMAPAEIPGLLGAIRSGKVIVQRGVSLVRGTTAAAGAAATGTGVMARAERGLQKARTLGLPESEIRTAEYAWERANLPYENADLGEFAFRNASITEGRKLLAAVDDIDGLVGAARAAGVPEAEIQAMLARARSTNTLDGYVNTLSSDLMTATANRNGTIFVVDKVPTSPGNQTAGLGAFNEFFGNGTIRPTNVVVTDAVALERVAANLTFMKEGRAVTWAQNDIDVLRRLLSGAGGDPLKMMRWVGDEKVFVRIFTEEQLATARQFASSPSRAAIASGNMLFRDLVPSVLVDARGALISPEAASALTAQQLGQVPFDFVQQLSATDPLTQALARRFAEVGDATARAWARDALAAADAARAAAIRSDTPSAPSTPRASGASGGASPAPWTGGMTKEDEIKAAKAMLDEGVGMAPGGSGGTMMVGLDGQFALTPGPGAPSFPGVLAPDGSLLIYAPGTNPGWSGFGPALLVTPPIPMDPGFFVFHPDGTRTSGFPENMAFTPFPGDGFPGPEYGGAGEMPGGLWSPGRTLADGPFDDPGTDLGVWGGDPGGCCMPGVQQMVIDFGEPATVAPSRGADAGSRPLSSVLRTIVAVLRTVAGTSPPSASMALAFANQPIGLPPAQTRSAGQTPAAPAAPLRTIITSLGNSQGEAFDMQIINTGDKPLKVFASALVVEPLKRQAQEQVRKEIARLIKGGALTRRVEAYCLDYGLAPPSPDALFQIAAPDVQRKFRPIASVLAAGRQLGEAGGLHPDSNPRSYLESIRQYAIWTKLGKWDSAKFGAVLLEKTKQAASAAKATWTAQMESVLMGAVPGRWRDIEAVLQEADRMAAGLR